MSGNGRVPTHRSSSAADISHDQGVKLSGATRFVVRRDTPAPSVDKVSKDLLLGLSAQFFEQTRESFPNYQRPICVGPTLVAQGFRDSVCFKDICREHARGDHLELRPMGLRHRWVRVFARGVTAEQKLLLSRWPIICYHQFHSHTDLNRHGHRWVDTSPFIRKTGSYRRELPTQWRTRYSTVACRASDSTNGRRVASARDVANVV